MTALTVATLIVLPTAIFALSQECFNKFSNLSHPFDCCHYPIADTLKTTADHCYHTCFQEPGFCCLYDCMYHEMMHFQNGKFTVDERIKYYDVDINNKKISRDAWLPIIERSVDFCDELIPVQLKDREACEMPEFMYMMFACEHLQNFLHCPTFENTKHCAELRKFVETETKCVLNYGNATFMRQEFWFVDEIYEEGDNFECLVWQLW